MMTWRVLGEILAERWFKLNLFALLGVIGALISSIVTLLGWLSASLGWFG